MAFAEHEYPLVGTDPKAMLHVPIGAASPLWALFAGAAVTGAAWWWMFRWSRPENLEALFDRMETRAAALPAAFPTETTPVAQAIESAPRMMETIADVAAAPVVEALEVGPAVLEAGEEIVEEAAAPMIEAMEQAADVIGTAEQPTEGAVEDAAATVETVTLEAMEPVIEPVGGESAPIAPALAAAAKAKRVRSTLD